MGMNRLIRRTGIGVHAQVMLGAGGGTAAIAQAFKTRVEADGGTFEGLTCLQDDIAEMGSFYNDAAWILPANGVKTSKIYTLKPTDGSGDLTFSRASTGFRKSSTVEESKAVNFPRLDYLNESCPNLLLESSKTNLTLRSQEFDNASWVKVNASISANATTAPDGTSTADKIIENTTASAAHQVRQNVTKAASALEYTFQVYVKKAEREWVRLLVWDVSSFGLNYYFNVNTGKKHSMVQLGNQFIDFGYGIEDVGSGWYKCWCRFRTNTATTIATNIALSTGDTVETYTGDGSSGLYVWGANLKQTNTVRIDSYIPSTTAAVTRSDDVISALTGVSSLIGQTEWTIFFKLKTWANDGVSKIFALSDGTTNNTVQIEIKTGITVKIITSGVTQATLVSNIFLSQFDCKIMITCQNNKAALFINGSKIAEDLSVTVPACSQINFTDGDGSNPFYANVKWIGISKTAYSDSEAATLTTTDSFGDLLLRTPPTRYVSNPIINNDVTYTNICTAGGLEEDPLDSSKFLFLLGQFLGAISVGARIKLYQGSISNPYSLSTDLGVVLQGSESYDINGCRFGCHKPILVGSEYWYYYVGIDAAYEWKICLAKSTDGCRSFTKYGVVLAADGVNEFSFSGPSVIKEGSTYYMIVTGWSGPLDSVANHNPGTSSKGIFMYTSSDGVNWTRVGKILGLGSTGQGDSTNLEDGQLIKIGNYYVIVYNASNGSTWKIYMAYNTELTSRFSKSYKTFFNVGSGWDSTLVSTPFIFEFPSGNKMYYQGASGAPISIGVADFNIV